MSECQYCGRLLAKVGALRSHETRCTSNPNNLNLVGKFAHDKIFVENSKFARHLLKKRILDYNLIEYKCQGCGNEGEWMGKPLTLVLDHINGVNNDNRLTNLRFMCSNCDSQLDTYKSRNRK